MTPDKLSDPQADPGAFAFIFTEGGGVQELVPLPGATYTEALGVNNLGDVVGASGNSQIRHAVLWNSSGEIEDLGVLPNDASSAANAINDSGEVVGASVGPYGSRAFIWTRAQ